jgi:23S rRNA (cytidine2498-2'-O)-methyltransferase
MHLLLCADDSERELLAEMRRDLSLAQTDRVSDLLFEADFPLLGGERAPCLAFLRQLLPNASRERCESISGWARLAAERIIAALPEDQPWVLHVEARYAAARKVHRIGARAWHSATREARPPSGTERQIPGIPANAGQHRAELIRSALIESLQKKRRHLLRHLKREPAAFTPLDSVVQLLLVSPAEGYLSVAAAPLPFEQRRLISPFPKGEVPVASDKAAPSRAFAKLVEAEQRLGRWIQPGETCVDLGASPGSWTYVAANRGARVLAVDRSPLREDLMRHSNVQFCLGDAFQFKPTKHPADWLLCDVIVPAESSSSLLIEWLQRKWCRNFVVTLKTKDAEEGQALTRLKSEMPALTREFFLNRLCANKKEVTVLGSRTES